MADDTVSTPSSSPAPIELTLPLPEKGIGSLKYWQGEIKDARERRQQELPDWRRDLDRTYRTSTRSGRRWGLRGAEYIQVPSDFYNVEQKRGQMFYKLPYVQATPERPAPVVPEPVPGMPPPAPPTDVVPAITPRIQHVINSLLGTKGANVKTAVTQSVIDVLASSGIGPCEIGYEAVYVTKRIPSGALDPATRLPKQVPVTGDDGEPVIDPATGAPQMEDEWKDVQVPIWDRYFWDHFSPARFLQPVSLTSNEYDKAPWLAREFDMDHEQMKATFGIEGDACGTFDAEESLAPERDRQAVRKTGRGVVIYYRARIFDPAAPPEQYRKLILVAGKRKAYSAVLHENVRYQIFDQDGRLKKGMVGNPIHPLTIRPVTDSAYPPSDTNMARPLSDAVSVGVSLMLKQRARNTPMVGVDTTQVSSDQAKRIENGEWMSMIPFSGPVTETMIREITSGKFPPENFAFQSTFQQELMKTWGFETTSQLGIGAGETATGATIAEQNKDIRVSTDREAVLEWFLKGVEKFATLPQVFGNIPRFVEMEGEAGARELVQWTRADVQGNYAFSLRPDSSQRINAAEQREIELKFNNLTANNAHVNQQQNVRDLAIAFNKDPARLMQPPPPPPKEEPRMAISFNGTDLDPRMPQYAAVLAILQGGDLQQLPPALDAPGSVPPDQIVRSAEPVPPVDKHDADLTGRPDGPRMPGR